MNRYAAALFAAITLAVPAAVPAAPPQPGSSGAKLCVLTQADFRTFGTVVMTKPDVNVDDDGNAAYCVYRGKSGATGGVELDVFDPAGSTPAEIAQTFKTVTASSPGANYQPEGVAGADQSVISLETPQAGYFPFAANAVRRGTLVFAISLPASPLAQRELMGLSRLVLARL